MLQFYSPYQKQWQKDIMRCGGGARKGGGKRGGEQGGGKAGRASNRFRSLTRKKLPSELKTHDEEIASMKQDHWAETRKLWEEMER